jgi:hypothetical protein
MICRTPRMHRGPDGVVMVLGKTTVCRNYDNDSFRQLGQDTFATTQPNVPDVLLPYLLYLVGSNDLPTSQLSHTLARSFDDFMTQTTCSHRSYIIL